MKTNEKYANSPIIFLDEQKRKEWENMNPSVKNSVFSMLHTYVDKMEQKATIEMLCHVIIDMDNRIRILEEEKKDG